MVSPQVDGYIGVDSREYPAAVTQDDLVVLAWSCRGDGYNDRERLPMSRSTAQELRDDLTVLLDEMGDDDGS